MKRMKLAFIGTHGVGKTTLCYGLAARLKRRDFVVEVVQEVARRCPLPINETTTVAAQQWILHTQIAEEITAAERLREAPGSTAPRSDAQRQTERLREAPGSTAPRSDAQRHPVVISDRSVLDNYVYLLLAAGRQVALEPLIAHWLATYDLLVHVPIVAAPAADGIRAADPAFQRSVDERLRQELIARELAPLFLDPGERLGWLEGVEAAVLERLAPAQLELL